MLFCLNTSSPWFKHQLQAFPERRRPSPAAWRPPIHQTKQHLCLPTFENTHISKVFVQQLHVSVQHFESEQLVVAVVQPSAEIQTGVPAGSKGKEKVLLQGDAVFVLLLFLFFLYGERGDKTGGLVAPFIFMVGSSALPSDKQPEAFSQFKPLFPPPVNDLQVPPLQKVAGARRAAHHQHRHVPDHLLLLPLC